MARKRINGEGSINYENARDKYRAAITDPNGKRIVKRFDNPDDAITWLSTTKSEIFKGSYIPPSDITVGEWLIEWLKTYIAPNVRPKTVLRYKQTMNYLTPLANIRLQHLTAHSVQQFYNDSILSNNAKNKLHKLLKAAITKAHILDLINKNIMLAIAAPRVEKTEIVIFSQQDIQQILNTLQSKSTNLRLRKYYPMMLLAITTGARLGEILGLKWPCVTNNRIIINNSLQEISGKLIDMPPKTPAGNRSIIVPEEVMSALNSLRQSDKVIELQGYVFHTLNRTPYAPRNIERIWKATLKAAGIEHKKFHCLRHTHATQLLASGIPLLEVAKRLGHSKASHTLDLYGHAIPGYDEHLPEKIKNIYSL